MPAASSKAEIKASLEVNEPIKQALAVVDKKVRNLEKRKLKLDAYKAKIAGGETLAKDQVAAIQHYDEVITSLECTRELQKQFLAINAEAEKLQKKQAKRDKMEKQTAEIKRTRDILALQNLLDNMGSEPVRHDFQTGKHGAVVLTEENISQLDELYKLISPTRDGPMGYNETLSSAAEHMVNLLDAREKEVTGTTYKDLKELLDLISGCGYFDKFPYKDDKEDSKENEYVLVEGQGPKSEDDLDSYQQEVEPEIPMPQHIQSQSNKHIEEVRSQDVESRELKKTAAEADLFFSSTQAYQHHAPPQAAQPPQSQRQRQRPIQEIVSSVQGSFNFLQESTIDMESPHMDPAVVAAHPMRTASPLAPHSTSSQTPDISSLSHSQSSFTTGFRDQQQLISENPSSADQTAASLLAAVAAAQQQVATSVQQDYTGSSFGQTHLSQSLQQSDRLFSVQDSNSMLGQSVSDATMSQFEMPPSIPMPPSHNQTQENQQQSQGEKKPFTMNPNAGEFQSLIYQNSSSGDSESQRSDLQISTDINQTGFQDAGFNSGGFHQQSQRGRSSYRGGRGGSGGRGGGSGGNSTMTNGFSRPRGGSRGRGGGGFQGYQRSDYHQDGYQGYNNSGGYNNNNYQKRGGGAGSTRGGNSHGSGGGMRAVGRGGPRGGSRGGPDTSRGGGFGKPNFNQQSAPMVQE